MSNHAERRPFLLEIGSEEIPARFIPTSMAAVTGKLAEVLAAAHLEHEPLRVVATPRRLTVLCDGVAVRQPDREEEVKGPPVSVAFDQDGQPTRAGEGFARKMGVDLADCGRDTDQRGEFLVVRRTIAGRDATAVLAEQLGALVLSLPFRKTMRWGELDIEYARPLQWLLCLLGDEVVPFSVGDLESGRTTRGHRTLSDDAVREVAAPGDYEQTLAEVGVIVDHERRRAMIVEQAAALLADLPDGGRLHEDDELLEEVVFLCEHPTAFLGSFDDACFELPDEVITTALKSHQRYFTVERPDGPGLRPCFLSVRDGGAEHMDIVRGGNERVLRARLADALFYWRFDQQRTPDQHAAALADVTWLEGFGSVADQTGRAAALATHLWSAGMGDGGEVPAALTRAAALSRFDLVTEMIKDGKEFTKLEGLIAARYAAKAGEDPAVCAALEQSLLPRSATGDLPADRASMVLSAAWRLDTLAGCWLAGFAPTGAKDPYALRRHVLAILRMVMETGARVDLADLVKRALAAYGSIRPEADLAAAEAAIMEFVQVRLEGWLVDNAGADQALVRAVLPVRGADPTDAAAWIGALDSFRGREDFLQLATGFKRCTNILKGDVLPATERAAACERWSAGGRTADGRDLAGLPEAAEQALHAAIAGAVPDLLAREQAGDYAGVFGLLSGFGPLIDTFFDDVRVNAEDADLRALRHGFLREIHALFLRYADFSRVLPEDD